jgi:hypothetical protein
VRLSLGVGDLYKVWIMSSMFWRGGTVPCEERDGLVRASDFAVFRIIVWGVG